MISHFWFGVLETVDLCLSFLFGFTTSNKLKALTLQLFSACMANGLWPSVYACMSETFTTLSAAYSVDLCMCERVC